MKKQVQEAIDRAKSWTTVGWKVTFGPRDYEVNSLAAAMELPRNFPYREEAVAYWRNVQGISEEVTKYLENALKDLEGGDRKGAESKLYAAQYHEKPLEKYTQTSKPIYDRLMNS